MTELAAVRALVELDPEAQREIQSWRDRLSTASDDERDDIRLQLDRYESGHEIIVRLAVTIELAGDDGGERRPGPSISGVWFSRDDQAGNAEHARQLIIQRCRPLLDELAETGGASENGRLAGRPRLRRGRRGGAGPGGTGAATRRLRPGPHGGRADP